MIVLDPSSAPHQQPDLDIVPIPIPLASTSTSTSMLGPQIRAQSPMDGSPTSTTTSQLESYNHDGHRLPTRANSYPTSTTSSQQHLILPRASTLSAPELNSTTKSDGSNKKPVYNWETMGLLKPRKSVSTKKAPTAVNGSLASRPGIEVPAPGVEHGTGAEGGVPPTEGAPSVASTVTRTPPTVKESLKAIYRASCESFFPIL